MPAGGLFSGAEEKKTAHQAEVWGGQADEPFDPNYHKETDTLDNIDRTALQIHRGGVAYSSASTRKISGAATGYRSATTAPATSSPSREHQVDRGHRGAGGGRSGVLFVEHPGAHPGAWA